MEQSLVITALFIAHAYIGRRFSRSLAGAVVASTTGFLSAVVLSGSMLGVLGALRAFEWSVAALGLTLGLSYVAWRKGAGATGTRIAYPGHTTVLLGVVLLSLVAMAAIKIYISDPANADDLEYHYPKIFHFIQSGSFQRTGLELVDGYPQNGELLAAFACFILGSLSLIDGVQLLVIPLFCASIWILAQSLGGSRSVAGVSALLGCFVPAVWSLIPTMHVDFLAVSLLVAAVALLFSADCFNKGFQRALFGALLGLLVGTKFVALPWVAVLLVASWFSHLRPRTIADVASMGLPLLLLGGERYLSNALEEGNPLYPYTIPFLGLITAQHPRLLGTLWEERMTVGIPYLEKLFTSWFSPTSIAQSNHEHWFGGFGLMWPILLSGFLCAVLVSAKRGEWRLTTLGVLASALFVVTPANYTTRFVLFLPAFAAVGFGVLLESLRVKRLELTRAIVTSLAVLAALHCTRQSVALFVSEVGPRRGGTVDESCSNVAVPEGLARLMRSPAREAFNNAKSVKVFLGDSPQERMISYACVWQLPPHLTPSFHDLSALTNAAATLPAGESLLVVSSDVPVELPAELSGGAVLFDGEGIRVFRVARPL